jgi:hypothetical protein
VALKARYGKAQNKIFCIECGLKCPLQKRHSPRAEIVVNGHRFVYCKQCRVHNGEVGYIGSGLCKRCHKKLWCGAGCKEKKVRVKKYRDQGGGTSGGVVAMKIR